MSAGALLAESIRVAVSGLRAIASALEEALRRFDNLNNDSGPAVDLESAEGRARPSSDWGLVTSAVVSEPPANTPPLVASVPALSVAGTDFSTESYHRVACSLDPLPGYCLDLCVRLGGTKEELEFRARRAWEAGLWARATLQGASFGPLRYLVLPVLILLLSSSGSSHLLLVRTQFPTPSLRLQKPGCIVLELELLCPKPGRDDGGGAHQDFGLRSKLAVRPVMASWSWRREEGGLRHPGLCQAQWCPLGSPFGFPTSRSSDCWHECRSLGSCGSICGDPMPWGAGIRQWRGGSGRPGDQLRRRSR